jgi:hypothetical protein
MNSPNPPVIQSSGAPPERHADRIVAAMMRSLAQQHAALLPVIANVLIHSADGSPHAQRKMEERIKSAGAIKTELTPGKRGKYILTFWDLTGWDPRRDAEITPTDPMPDKPWLVCHLNAVRSAGKGRNKRDLKSMPVVFITHHVLSRVAQRLGATLGAHLIAAIHAILNATIDFMLDDLEHFLDAPPNGHRVQTQTSQGTITLILKRHEKRKALVAATIF